MLIPKKLLPSTKPTFPLTKNSSSFIPTLATMPSPTPLLPLLPKHLNLLLIVIPITLVLTMNINSIVSATPRPKKWPKSSNLIISLAISPIPPCPFILPTPTKMNPMFSLLTPDVASQKLPLIFLSNLVLFLAKKPLNSIPPLPPTPLSTFSLVIFLTKA